MKRGSRGNTITAGQLCMCISANEETESVAAVNCCLCTHSFSCIFFSFPFCELGMGVKDAGPAEGGWDRRISGRRSREREGDSKGKVEE